MVDYQDFRFVSFFLGLVFAFVFILELMFPSIVELFILDGSKIAYEPYRLITAIFLHANAQHLVQNLFALLIFGLVFEGVVGWKRFLEVFFLGGIFGNVVIVLYQHNVVALGASGAIMAIIGALAVLRPWASIYFYMPIPVIALAIVYFALDFIGLIFPYDNTGYAAHLGGLAFGVFWGLLNKKKYDEHKKLREEILKDVDEKEIEEWEKKFMS